MSVFRVYEECGADGYPLAWHSIDGGPGVKDLVREEAGHRCVRCGHPYPPGIAETHPRGEWTPCDSRCTHAQPVGEGYASPIAMAHWRILTVHHLRLGDDAKRDLRWWNLAALCQRCHLKIQGKVQMERVWPWEHSEWFKPYAAGWYAASYLGEELSRVAVMSRLDELLALELAAPVPVSAGEDAAWAERARG